MGRRRKIDSQMAVFLFIYFHFFHVLGRLLPTWGTCALERSALLVEGELARKTTPEVKTTKGRFLFYTTGLSAS